MLRFLLVLFLLTTSGLSAHSLEFAQKGHQQDESDRFEKALVMTGGGAQYAVYFGIYRAAMEAGFHPDLLVSVCGASIASRIILSFPEPKKLEAYALSRDFHDLMIQMELEITSVWGAAKVVGKMKTAVDEERYPSIFEFFLLNVPSDGLDALPPLSLGAPAWMMVGTRLAFTPDQVEQRLPENARPYQEVFFTDSVRVTELLDGFESPIAALENSRIQEATQVITSLDPGRAARISASDPYLMEPVCIEGCYYVAGSADLYPIEAAQTLARKIAIPYSGKFNGTEDLAIRSTFGFNNNQDRLPVVNSDQVAPGIRFDMLDADQVYSQFGFNPREDGMRIINRIPSDWDSFREKVRQQMDWGYKVGQAAFQKK